VITVITLKAQVKYASKRDNSKLRHGSALGEGCHRVARP